MLDWGAPSRMRVYRMAQNLFRGGKIMKKSKCVRALSLLLALVTVLGVVAVLPIGAQNASAAEMTGSELAGI